MDTFSLLLVVLSTEVGVRTKTNASELKNLLLGSQILEWLVV